MNLLHVSESLERYLDTQLSMIKAVVQELSQKQMQALIATVHPVNLSSSILGRNDSNTAVSCEPISQASTEERYSVYLEVKRLQQQGHGQRTIARHLGISRNTVRKYFNQPVFVPKRHGKRSNLLEFGSYLRKRWSEADAAKLALKNYYRKSSLWAIMASISFWQLSWQTIPERLMYMLCLLFKKELLDGTPLIAAVVLVLLYVKKKKTGLKEQKPFLSQLLQKYPMQHQARELSLEFKTMMEHKKGEELANWCCKAEKLPRFESFVRGIHQDFLAVQQALSSIWSKGQTEWTCYI